MTVIATAAPPVRGFLGGTVVNLPELERATRPGAVVAFGIDNEIGRQFGAGNGGAASYLRGLTADLGEGGCHDIGVLRCRGLDQSLQDVMLLAGHIARMGRRPVLLACDHTASLGGVLGVHRGLAAMPLYLYFDAHLDLGWHLPRDRLDNGNFVDQIRRSGVMAGVVNIGARGIMLADPCYHGADLPGWLPAGDAASLGPALDAVLAAHPDAPVYVSIDADVLDPASGVAVCCPEPQGLSGATLLALCRRLGASGRVAGADLCEVRPLVARGDMERMLGRCLRALFALD